MLRFIFLGKQDIFIGNQGYCAGELPNLILLQII